MYVCVCVRARVRVCVCACACVCAEPKGDQRALASTQLPLIAEDPAHDMYEYAGDRIELEWQGDIACVGRGTQGQMSVGESL